MDILMLLAGLALLIIGGNWVTDGGSDIARRLHMSGLLVGLTIVALGSSTPDLCISLFSTIKGHSQMAVGDVVGANIFDFLLVIGIVALVKPITVQRGTLTGDLPVAVIAAWTLFFLADDKFIDGAAANVLTRSDGLVMISGYALFMVYTVMASRQPAPLVPERVKGAPARVVSVTASRPVWLSITMLVGGFGALVIGGNWFVDGASEIAERAGWSEGLVGLTIVAVGSSLPDLATSVIAALKHEPGIAVGNVLGSCIINGLLVLGLCAVVAPLDAGTVNLPDFLTLCGAATALLVMALVSRTHTIGRVEGACLVGAYCGYMATLIATS